jgi:hypothetical protein
MKTRLIAWAVLLTPVSAYAQTQAAPAAPEQAAVLAPVVQQSRLLPAGTMLNVASLQELSSKHIKEGDRYKFEVVNDVAENGVVVIPRGSIATGVVSMQTGRAVGGKSGKFDITFESVTANGRTFKLAGVHRQEGKGNTVGALLGSILISGHSAVMLPGQVVTAMTAEPTPY